jgi:hypothetical protein
MKNLLIILILTFTSLGFSQRWHFQYGFKFGAGKNFLRGEEKIENGYNFNYILGFNGRITHKTLIMDLGLNFQYSPYFNSTYIGHKRTNTIGLNIPYTIGAIIVNKPLFKWNIQGGIQNSFIFTNGFEKQTADQFIYNPYQLSGIISTGIEVAWFTFDIYYQPAITRMFKGYSSGFNQSLNIGIGFIF